MALACAAPAQTFTADEAYGAALAAYDTAAFGQARELAELAAQNGNARAAVLLGYLLERGLGGRESQAQAARWYRAAGELGDADALFALGVMAREGRGGLSPASAEDYLRRAADAGRLEARHELALTFLNPAYGLENRTRGRTLLEQAAAEGVAAAQRDLGRLLIEEDDVEDALSWLRLAADAGDAEAQFTLGYLYAEGQVIEPDDARAREYLHEAAEAGHPAASADYGWLLYLDAANATERHEAVAWLAQAAEGDDAEGHFRYAWALAENAAGMGDLVDAYRQLLLAERAGEATVPAYRNDRERLRAWLENALAELPGDRAAEVRAQIEAAD